MARGALVPTTSPVYLSVVQTAMGGASLYGCRPGTGTNANTNTIGVKGWISATPNLSSYAGASNVNMVAANTFTGQADAVGWEGGGASSGVWVDINANGTFYTTYNGDEEVVPTHGNWGYIDNKWLKGTVYDNDAAVGSNVDVRFTKTGGTASSWGLSNNTWFAISTQREIVVSASRSSPGGSSESVRGWLAFRRTGDSSNTLIGNTFIDITAGVFVYSGPPP